MTQRTYKTVIHAFISPLAAWSLAATLSSCAGPEDDDASTRSTSAPVQSDDPSYSVVGGVPSSNPRIARFLTDSGETCTAFIVGDRCMATAAHCAPKKYETGAVQFDDDIANKRMLAVQQVTSTRMDPIRDFAVMRVSTSSCTTDYKAPCVRKTDWPKIGLSGQSLSPTDTYKTIGYGMYTDAGTAYDGFYLGVGSQHMGYILGATTKFKTINGTSGSYHEQYVENAPYGSAPAPGDSGGPLLDMGETTAYGILNYGYDNPSTSTFMNSWAGFANGGKAWMDAQIAEVCAPRVGLAIWVAAGAGSISITQAGFTTTKTFSEQSTDRNMGATKSKYTINVTVKPAVGYTFSGWGIGLPGLGSAECPCTGTNLTCSIDPATFPVGAPWNVEVAYCRATFTRI